MMTPSEFRVALILGPVRVCSYSVVGGQVTHRQPCVIGGRLDGACRAAPPLLGPGWLLEGLGRGLYERRTG